MPLRARFRPLLLLPALLFPALLAGRQGDSEGKKAAKLFRATDPVALWLSADFKTVFKERDSTSTKQFPASMRFIDKSDTTHLDVRLSLHHVSCACACRTSFTVIRPSLPVPSTSARSMPSSSATRSAVSVTLYLSARRCSRRSASPRTLRVAASPRSRASSEAA